MPLDIDAIRARHEPYADTRVAQDIAALLSELDRLTSELAAAPGAARRWEGLREAAATVQAATGLGGDTPLDDDRLAEMVANALQDAARAHYAETALRTDAEAHSKATAHLRGLVEGQRARAERAEAELAAARRGPVVEWLEDCQWSRVITPEAWKVVDVCQLKFRVPLPPVVTVVYHVHEKISGCHLYGYTEEEAWDVVGEFCYIVKHTVTNGVPAVEVVK